MTSVQLTYTPSDKKYPHFGKLLSKNWAMLLDSGINNRATSTKAGAYRRYDICVCDPSVRLTAHQNNLTIQRDEQEEETSNQDALTVMRGLLAEFSLSREQVDISQPALPFNGGWLGYISYDFGHKLQQNTLKYSDAQKSTDNPNVPLIRMGLYQWAIISDHLNETTTLYNFGLSNDRWNKLKHDIDSLLNHVDIPTPLFLIKPFKSNLSYQDYAKVFKKSQDYIHAGDCYQVNFSQRFFAEFRGNAFDIYTTLTKANNSPFSAYLNFSDQQILCLSPERFIESHNGEVTTQPIKGTLPRDPDPIKDKMLAEKLACSEKDKSENLMIVDLLRNDLSKTAAKASVKVTELFGLYQFESVHHLISTIKSKLKKPFDNFDLLATTLPGGSITGAPKVRAMQIIDELETTKRGIYCGVIGYIDFDGNMDTNICIRTLIADNRHLYCWAGGGLVADSDLDSEYQETFDKLNKILPVLNSTVNKPIQVGD